MHALHLQRAGCEDSQYVHPADHGIKKILVQLRGAPHLIAGGEQGTELKHMFPYRPRLVIVLAVDIDTQASPQGRRHRTGYHGRPPTIRKDLLPEFLKGYTRFAADDPAIRVPFQDPVDCLTVKDEAPSVHGDIVIASTGSPDSDRNTILLAFMQDILDLIGRFGFHLERDCLQRMTKILRQ